MRHAATDKPSFIASAIRRWRAFWTPSTTSTAASRKKAIKIGPAEAQRRLEQGRTLLIDVREPHEHARERIPGARLVPLSRFDAHDFSADWANADAAIFHCHSGMRTAVNARRLLRAGFHDIFVLKGGIQAWKRAGYGTSDG